MDTRKIYLILDEKSFIKEWSTGTRNKENEIVIETDLIDEDTDFLSHKYINGQLVELTEEEKKLTIQHQPTPEEKLRAKLIKDNADMQLQLAQQQKLNADILLKLASLGGSTNV